VTHARISLAAGGPSAGRASAPGKPRSTRLGTPPATQESTATPACRRPGPPPLHRRVGRVVSGAHAELSALSDAHGPPGGPRSSQADPRCQPRCQWGCGSERRVSLLLRAMGCAWASVHRSRGRPAASPLAGARADPNPETRQGDAKRLTQLCRAQRSLYAAFRG
jgi:hypothetical protein